MPGLNKSFDVDRISTNNVAGGGKYIVHHPGGFKDIRVTDVYITVQINYRYGQYELFLSKTGVEFLTLRNTDAVMYFTSCPGADNVSVCEYK